MTFYPERIKKDKKTIKFKGLKDLARKEMRGTDRHRDGKTDRHER